MIDYEEELNRIKAEESSLDKMKINQQQLILYGAGELGKMAMSLFRQTDIRPVHIVDKKAEGNLDDIPIIRISDLTETEKQEATFLITICTIPYNQIVEELKAAGIKNMIPFYVYAYTTFSGLLSNGWFVEKITDEVEQQIHEICYLLKQDNQSLAHYLQFCNWKLKGIEQGYKEYPVLSHKKYFLAPCMPKLTDTEYFVDCGCHYGGSIQLFLNQVGTQYNQIIGFEPDLENLKLAKQNLKDIPRLEFRENPLWSHSAELSFKDGLGFASHLMQEGNQKVQAISIDELNLSPTILKIHVEGAELEVLQGAIQTIQRCRPVIMVFADHSVDGLYSIPAFIKHLDRYTLHFCLHDYCGNSAIFYMIPWERKINESRI